MARTGDLRCGVCGGNASTASCDEATFVAECSHVFHFRCVAAASAPAAAGTCPVCATRWRQALAVTLRPAPAVQLVKVPCDHRPEHAAAGIDATGPASGGSGDRSNEAA